MHAVNKSVMAGSFFNKVRPFVFLLLITQAEENESKRVS